ncbi:TlpA disulfide reductase family protein [Chitinophaga sp. YIM B06452]|uniref:TlpA family protein disulfide reductase n=1 Tax=Chitinophaga sp. YIM B06452 TaxID=3082158 RepID=UPI0031FE9AE1
MFRSFIALILCSCAFKATAQPQLKIDSVTVAGQYSHYTHQPGNVFSVIVYDWTSSYQKKYSAPIDASGKFSIRFPFPVAGDILLDWDRIGEVNGALPGETIRFYADLDEYKNGKKPVNTRFEGINANMHAGIMRYRQDVSKFPGEEFYKLRDHVTSSMAFRDSVTGILQRSLRTLDEYAGKRRLDKHSRQFLEADLRYAAVAALSQFSRTLSDSPRDLSGNGYFQTLDSIKALAQSGGFFTGDYMTVLRDIKFHAYMTASKNKTKNIDSVLNPLLDNPVEKELSKTWDLSLKLAASNPLEDSALQAFETKVKNPFLRSEIHARNNELVMLAQDDRLLENTRLITSIPQSASAEEMLAHIASRFKGKVIYMDIWGTWCMPCREQMKYTPVLKQRLKGKDVVFVYLANRSPETAWKNAIKQHAITGDNVVHFNLPAAQQSMIEKKYLYGGFPTYIIIDKEGKFVTNQAPRPSEPDAVVKAISDLL